MLKISRLADYSVVVMCFLARHFSTRYSAAAIAEATHIALPTVSKVLKLLNEAGLLASSRGANGGYQLATTPDAINLAQVVTAIDGKPAVTECTKGENLCAFDHWCELRSNWQLINHAMMDVLTQLSIQDMSKPLKKPLERL